MKFINISVIILLVNFNFAVGTNYDQNDLFLGFIPIFNGSYPEFVSDWYKNVGTTLCITMILNIFSPFISKFSFLSIKLL
jgi:hypothetical protein